jgi:16S rRNA (uracil1498-N3)-methyltransferase
MAQQPHFFYNNPLVENSTVSLDRDTAKHIWQVLRMEPGDKVVLTDGNGSTAEGSIHTAERHQCDVAIGNVSFYPRQGNILYLGICFTKNNSRNEWLLEKATELGVAFIIPVNAARSEKTYVRNDRWQKILQSAILQSKQHYLPVLTEITPLAGVLEKYSGLTQKLVAHWIDDKNKKPFSETLKPSSETILLIGPEGDFTQNEVNLCMEHGFKPVSLGAQRLRTETAAIAAAAYFNLEYNE